MNNHQSASAEIPDSAYLDAMTPLVHKIIDCFLEERPAKNHIKRYALTFVEELNEQGALLPPDSDAVKLLSLTLTQHRRRPDNPIAWFNLAVALRLVASSCPNDPKEQYNHRLALAVNACSTAVRIDPTATRCWTELGINLFLLGETDQALTVFEEALQIQPDDAPLWLWKAFTCEQLGRHDEALASVQQAQALHVAGSIPEALHHLFRYQSLNDILNATITTIHRSIGRGPDVT